MAVVSEGQARAGDRAGRERTEGKDRTERNRTERDRKGQGGIYDIIYNDPDMVTQRWYI